MPHPQVAATRFVCSISRRSGVEGLKPDFLRILVDHCWGIALNVCLEPLCPLFWLLKPLKPGLLEIKTSESHLGSIFVSYFVSDMTYINVVSWTMVICLQQSLFTKFCKKETKCNPGISSRSGVQSLDRLADPSTAICHQDLRPNKVVQILYQWWFLRLWSVEVPGLPLLLYQF